MAREDTWKKKQEAKTIFCKVACNFNFSGSSAELDRIESDVQGQCLKFEVRIDDAIWYRIELGSGVCEEILCFDANVPWLGGVIGDKLYYFYMDSQEMLYVRDLTAEAEEWELMTVTAEGMLAMPFVLDGRLLLITDCCLEEGNHMVEYTVLDPEGKVLDTICYDDYLTFLDVVGNKIMYFKLKSDFEYEIWWVEKEDLKDLLEKGVQIGPSNGAALDTLKD